MFLKQKTKIEQQQQKNQDKSWDLSAATHLKSAFIVLNHY